jgi:hypothetical protein
MSVANLSARFKPTFHLVDVILAGFGLSEAGDGGGGAGLRAACSKYVACRSTKQDDLAIAAPDIGFNRPSGIFKPSLRYAKGRISS